MAKRAFTLIEIMMVIAIISVVFLLALPSIQSLFDDQALQSRIREFHKFVLKARLASMTSGQKAVMYWTEEEIRLEMAPRYEPEDFSVNSAEGLEASIEERLAAEAAALEKDDQEGSEPQPGTMSFPLNPGHVYSLKLPSRLLKLEADKESPPRWAFWPSGTCEPADVSYQGPDGFWTLRYNPLNANYSLIAYGQGKPD